MSNSDIIFCFFIPKQVVLYRLCETYTEIGIENIGLVDVGSGSLNFIKVALGGTIVGK